MAWYDALPFRSLAKVPGNISDGNFSEAGKNLFVGGTGADTLLAAKNYLYDDPADQQREALGGAAESAHRLAREQRDFRMKGLDQSLGHFGNADATFAALYGDPGSLRK
jgi:hypothetical protein